MTIYRKNGTSFVPAKEENLDLRKELPPGNYVIKVDPHQNLYLDKIDNFSLPSKVYGNSTNRAGRIINTYQDRSGSTGVLLAGEKGSGKTMLAKMLAIIGYNHGYPTIVINTPYAGDKFNELLQSITQPCIVLFDEFEKVYDKDDQKEVLTLLDGVFPTKKLFILTVNDIWAVDHHMLNRPGRLFYSLIYEGVGKEFIIEYCNDVLEEELKFHIPSICRLASLFTSFNFDSLKAIVEEMNRYNESPDEVLELLNVSPESSSMTTSFMVSFSKDGKDLTDRLETYQKDIECNPLEAHFKLYLDFYASGIEDGEEGEGESTSTNFHTSDIKKITDSASKFMFTNKEGYDLILTKKINTFSYHSLL